MPVVREAQHMARGGDQCTHAVAGVAELEGRLSAESGEPATSPWAWSHKLSTADQLASAHRVEQIAAARVLVTQKEHREEMRTPAQLPEAAGGYGALSGHGRVKPSSRRPPGDTNPTISAPHQTLSLAEPQSSVLTGLDWGETMAAPLSEVKIQGGARRTSAECWMHLGWPVGLRQP